ncbi:MAG: helix-turn-helix transcriptional regulator [Lachnospiraceae bacterium]|nr:helix-turn-helix transcriptional regulator [Lachnospiraceae bacterium]
MIKDLYELQQIEELVERIDKLRVEHNYSIYELAVRSGLSVNTIKYLYKKKSFPNIRTLYNICEGFEIPIWLLFYKSESNSFITKSEYTLINNFSKLSDTGKRLLMELSENLK